MLQPRVGTGTQMAPNQRGIAKVTGEGTMWTSAHRLSHLNGGRWKVEGKGIPLKRLSRYEVTS